MASLNGAMPTASPETGLMHVSSLGSLNTMVPLSTSYATPIPPQSPFASGAPTGTAILISSLSFKEFLFLFSLLMVIFSLNFSASGVYFDQDNGEQPRR